MDIGQAAVDTMNQQGLAASLAALRAMLEGGGSPEAAPPAPSLDRLCAAFDLSSFERDILLLCAGFELDSAFASLLAAEPSGRPSLGWALASLPDPHWSAVAPSGGLRRWRLIDFAAPVDRTLLQTPIRADERILHHLVGIRYVDPRIEGLLDPVSRQALAPSQSALADRIAGLLRRDAHPLIQLCGANERTNQAVAAEVAGSLGLGLMALRPESFAASGDAQPDLRLCEREARLDGSALCVQADLLDRSDQRATWQVTRLLERTAGPVFLCTRDRWRPIQRPVHSFDVVRAPAAEQVALWRSLLQDAGADANAAREVGRQFNLSGEEIRASVQQALGGGAAGDLAAALWESGRHHGRPRLDDLAQRIEPRATLSDLVLPQAERDVLGEIVTQVAHRQTVHHDWGFAEAGARGLGMSALFSGASGTGKTMAAEAVAQAMRLDLYRIDLSSVVNKYIGETEKNLRRVFDAAESGGAILFFDEADSLFGKRTEVRDSHDRFANLEVNYLLQRMESYTGLSILATNMKGALDTAFLRRLRFVVNFPFPDAAARAALWRGSFPAATPTEGLDIAALSGLNVSGGNIRNIALNAAFFAASEKAPVRMQHVLRAVRGEYAKIERPLTELDMRGWR